MGFRFLCRWVGFCLLGGWVLGGLVLVFVRWDRVLGWCVLVFGLVLGGWV